MERSSNYRGEGNAGPHPSGVVDTTEVFRIQLHGISEREKCDDDFRASRKFEVQIWEPAFPGNSRGSLNARMGKDKFSESTVYHELCSCFFCLYRESGRYIQDFVV